MPDAFFDAALHVPVLKEGLVDRHGSENPGTVLRLYASAAFHVVVIDTYLAPPAPTLRCNYVIGFRGC